MILKFNKAVVYQFTVVYQVTVIFPISVLARQATNSEHTITKRSFRKSGRRPARYPLDSHRPRLRREPGQRRGENKESAWGTKLCLETQLACMLSSCCLLGGNVSGRCSFQRENVPHIIATQQHSWGLGWITIDKNNNNSI